MFHILEDLRIHKTLKKGQRHGYPRSAMWGAKARSRLSPCDCSFREFDHTFGRGATRSNVGGAIFLDGWVGGLGSWGSVVREFLEGAFFWWMGWWEVVVSELLFIFLLFFVVMFLHHFENFMFIKICIVFFESISCLYTFGSFFRIVAVVTNRHTSIIVLSISIHL